MKVIGSALVLVFLLFIILFYLGESNEDSHRRPTIIKMIIEQREIALSIIADIKKRKPETFYYADGIQSNVEQTTQLLHQCSLIIKNSFYPLDINILLTIECLSKEKGWPFGIWSFDKYLSIKRAKTNFSCALSLPRLLSGDFTIAKVTQAKDIYNKYIKMLESKDRDFNFAENDYFSFQRSRRAKRDQLVCPWKENLYITVKRDKPDKIELETLRWIKDSM